MNTVYKYIYIATLVLIGLSNLDILIPELDILREVFLQTQSDCGLETLLSTHCLQCNSRPRAKYYASIIRRWHHRHDEAIIWHV